MSNQTARRASDSGTPSSPDESGQKLLPHQDESYQCFAQDNQLIILDTEDDLTIGSPIGIASDMTAYAAVRIYAEDVTIGEPIRANDLYLSVYNLSNVDNAGINASGADGEPGGPDTEASGLQALDGKPGGDGHQVTLILGAPQDRDLSLPVVAGGGAGGRGQSNRSGDPGSTGGSGRDGGDGGVVFITARHLYKLWLELLKTVHDATQKQDMKAAVTELVSRLNDRRDLAANLPTENGRTLLDAAQEMESKFDGWNDGQISALQSLSEEMAHALQAKLSTWRVAALNEVNVAPGNYGVYGAGVIDGRNGVEGSPGTRQVSAFARYTDLQQSGSTDLLFAHPDQCAMLLQKAEMLYFSADPVVNRPAIVDAGNYLDRLIDRTSPFARLQPQDALYKAYNDSETQRKLGSGDCVQTLTSVFNNASILRQQLAHGLDYFGHLYNFAPLASYEFYSGQVNQMLVWFKDLEACYNNYFQASAADTERQNALAQALQTAKQVQGGAQSDADQLYAQARKTLTYIQSYEPAIASQHKQVSDLLITFKEKLSNHFDFNLSALFSSMSVVAFAPESPWMWASQAGQTAYKFDTELVTDDGQSIPKDYLVRQVSTIEGSVDSILEGYKRLSDGTLSEDDPGANLLLANRDALFQALDQVYSKFKSDLSELKDAFQTYVNTLLERNQNIINYNAIVLMSAKKMEIVRDTQSKIDAINKQLTLGYKPDLPIMKAFVSRTYHQARQQVLETLYLQTRALQFWALSDDNLIAETIGSYAVANINTSVLDAANIRISTEYRKAVESFGRGAQAYPSNPDNKGIEIHLDDNQIQQLKHYNSLLINLPNPDSTDKSENPFAGFANVRLTKARLWLQNASTSDNKLQIRLTHSGSETLLSQSGDDYQFTHDRVTVIFNYNLSDNSINEDGDFELKPSGADQKYALLGPFTSWQIEIADLENKDLKLDNLTSAVLEFHITNYALD
jgi:hypothetical protein